MRRGVIHELLLLHSFWIVPRDTCLHFFCSDNRMMKLSVVTAIFLLRFVAVFADFSTNYCGCGNARALNALEPLPTPRGSGYRLLGKSSSEENCKCDNASSKHFEAMVTKKKCCKGSKGSKKIGKKRGRNLDEDTPAIPTQTRPQGTPKYDNPILLSEDTGIWILPDFLDGEGVQTMLQAFEAGEQHFFDCKLHACTARPSLPRCQKNPGAVCLLVSEQVKSHLSEPAKMAWEDLNSKLQAVWPQYPFTAPLLAQVQEGEVGPFRWHIDGQDLLVDHGIVSPVTIVVYLTDSDSQLIFPYANSTGIAITPKAGMAVSFFNIDEDNKVLYTAIHGVSASPADAGVRLSISAHFAYAPELHSGYGPVEEIII
jgi:hypothetical protein